MRDSRKHFRLVLLLALGLVLNAPVFGQRLTGEIRLEVKDSSGAPMKASGKLESLAAGIQRTFETDSAGKHSFGALPFGTYRLEVGRDGFSTQTHLIEVRSEVPLTQAFTMAVAPLASSVEIRIEATLIDSAATGSAQHLGGEFLEYRRSSAPGRSAVDLVNTQPGWLLEANGVLHPRGSEYDVQYVVDGIPLYDNRSPAFAQSLSFDEFETMTVRTANFPAEFGRKMGGVIEVNTHRDARAGLHGQTSLQAGSFRQRSGFASLQYAKGGNSFSVSGEGMKTDRYLDPPVIENYTNRGSGGGISGRFDRTWSASDTTRFYFQNHHTGFLVPNELLQQAAGQRQDRTADETMGQVSHTRLLSTRALVQGRAMIRDTSARLWSNPASFPILPDQDRGFQEKYFGGSVSINHSLHEVKFGGDAIFRSIREAFGYTIITRRVDPGNVRIFDGDVPLTFRFEDEAKNRQQSFFVQDLWRRGGLSLNAGMRFDHYALRNSGETAWSPRLGLSYLIPKADLVLRAAYDRVFQEPAIENLLLATSDLVEDFGGEGVFLPLRPGRGDFIEAGFSKRLFGQLRLDGTWYRRRMQNFADDSLLLNTGVTFPVAFNEGRIVGYEAKIELPRWRRVSAFATYSNMAATGFLPVAGGLLLGDEAEEALEGEGSFPITQDQRNTVRARIRVQAHSRAWAALGASYNSGLPFEIEGPANMAFIAQQYGPKIIGKVNFDRGRVRPSGSLDASVGVNIMQTDRATLRLQADVFNLTNRFNMINFSGILSGTALEAGRNFTVRLNAGF